MNAADHEIGADRRRSFIDDVVNAARLDADLDGCFTVGSGLRHLLHDLLAIEPTFDGDFDLQLALGDSLGNQGFQRFSCLLLQSFREGGLQLIGDHMEDGQLGIILQRQLNCPVERVLGANGKICGDEKALQSGWLGHGLSPPAPVCWGTIPYWITRSERHPLS